MLFYLSGPRYEDMEIDNNDLRVDFIMTLAFIKLKFSITPMCGLKKTQIEYYLRQNYNL